MHIKLISFLRLIVSSCIAEFDLFKLICKTLIFLPFSRDSEASRERVRIGDGKLLGEDVRVVCAGIVAVGVRPGGVGLLVTEVVEDDKDGLLLILLILGL